jgi:hypothetical protein
MVRAPAANIPSMAALHPNLAPLVATFPELGTAEAQGQLLRPAALSEAHRVVDLAEATHGMLKNVTVLFSLCDTIVNNKPRSCAQRRRRRRTHAQDRPRNHS